MKNNLEFLAGNEKKVADKSVTQENKDNRIVELFLAKENIQLLEEFSSITLDELKAKFAPGSKIVACDFAIKGVEKVGNLKPWGFEAEEVTSIDHHAPVEEMSKMVSSTTLAIEMKKSGKKIDADAIIAVNHTDCDSVLTMAILSDILQPEEKFNEAAIAADHTGEENEIADLLQAIQSKRDLQFSLKNLQALLNKEPLDEEAEKLLEKRFADRKKAQEAVSEGHFTESQKVFYISLAEKIDGAFFPALVSEAGAIVVCSPMPDGSGKFSMKTRLGMQAPIGFVLNKAGLPDFGGRWNAGDTKRNGGTAVSVEKFASLLEEAIEKYKQESEK